MKSLFGTAMLALLAITDVNAAPTTAVLTCSPCESLPGVALPFTLEVKNGFRTPVAIPRWAVAYVQTRGGADANVTDMRGRRTFNLVDDGETSPVVAPNQTGRVDIGMSVDLSGPWFYLDPRLSRPGEYEIWLELWDEDFQCDGCIPGVVPEPRMVTSPARLVVRTPSGADAAVWKLMQEQSCRYGSWTPDCLLQSGLIDVIVREHRESAYFPYAAALKRVHDRDARMAMIEDAIARHPTSVLRGFLEWRLASDYDDAAYDAEVRRNDLVAAEKFRQKQYEHLKRALAGTLPPGTRRGARERLDVLIEGYGMAEP